MSTKFKLPETDLYLSAKGLYTNLLDPDDSVVLFTASNIGILDAALRGQALNLQASGSTATAGKVIQLSGGFLKLIPVPWVQGVGAAAEWGGKVVEFMGSSEPDPLMVALDEIHQELKRAQDFALAGWVTAREENLAFLRAHSSVALHTALKFVRDGARLDDPVWAARIALAERDSLVAVRTFTSSLDEGYWMRPESLHAISWAGPPADYYRGWMPHIPDRAEVDGFHRVWDYRWALSAVIYAITVRVFVLHAFFPGTRSEEDRQRTEIAGYVAFLNRVFSKRLAGVRALRELNELQILKYSTSDHVPLVAVDLYGGDYIAGNALGGIATTKSFKPGALPPGLEPAGLRQMRGPGDFATIQHNVRIVGDHWWNVLFLRSGGEDLLLYISELHARTESSRDQEVEFSRWLNEIVRSRTELGSGEVGRAARVAASLSDLFADDVEPDIHAARTNYIFEALRSGDAEAGAKVQELVRTLEGIGMRVGGGQR